MGKPTTTNANALHTPCEELDLHQAHEPPSRPSSSTYSNRASPPRHLRYQGLASASQASTESLVERIAREHSSPHHGQSIGDAPQPYEQLPYPHVEHIYEATTHNHLIVCPTVERRDPTSATTEVSIKPVPGSGQGSNSGDKARVKVLLYGDGRDYFSAADLECLKAMCRKYIEGIRHEDIRVHSGSIGKEFDWFFNPDDITPGGLLILCVTGHGVRTIHGVDLKTNKRGPKLMDTLDLHKGINRLQIPCTLEVILGTCNSEAVISGLDRLLAMQVLEAPKDSTTLPPLSALFRTLYPSHLMPKLTTKAVIIVWAAAVDGGLAYEEMDLPGRIGTNDVMIGAIYRALESAGRTMPRKALFGKIDKAVSEHNTARDEKYFNMTEEQQRKAQDRGKYGDPQLACLLSWQGNRELILNGLAFEAIDPVDIS